MGIRSSTTTDEDGNRGCSSRIRADLQREQHGRSTGRVVTSDESRHGREGTEHSVGLVVEENGITVCEDEEVAIRQQMHEWVETILVVTMSLRQQQTQLPCGEILFGYVLVGGDSMSTDDDAGDAIRKQLVGGVPSSFHQLLAIDLHPVANPIFLARRESPNLQPNTRV